MIAAGRHEEPIVRVRNEELFGPVEKEAERQKDLDVGPVDQHALVRLLGVLQVADADGVGALPIAHGVERIEDLMIVVRRSGSYKTISVASHQCCNHTHDVVRRYAVRLQQIVIYIICYAND